MKKSLLSFAILVIAVQAKSSDYLELVKAGNKWNYLATAYTTCCGSLTKTYSLFLSGDTLIDNVNYKKMMCDQIGVNYRITIYAGAIRENIEEQSVYFRAKDSEEKKVYSFDYKTGDTISVDIINSNIKTIRFAKSVEAYNFGDYTSKKIVVCDTTYYESQGEKYSFYYDTWYEGIGSNQMLFEFDENFYNFPFSQKFTELLCFWNNDIQIYQSPNFTFCENAEINSDIKEINNSLNITIFPNPTKDILNITTDLEITTIKIYSITGSLLLETNHKTIDVSKLSNGIFIVKVILSSNEIIEKKIIKNNT